MTTISVHTPRPVAAPRGAALAANLITKVMTWLEAVGTARAASAMRRLEATHATEAAQLRRYAQTWAEHDPRFAADLLAAADRHGRTE